MFDFLVDEPAITERIGKLAGSVTVKFALYGSKHRRPMRRRDLEKGVCVGEFKVHLHRRAAQCIRTHGPEIGIFIAQEQLCRAETQFGMPYSSIGWILQPEIFGGAERDNIKIDGGPRVFQCQMGA